jgi:hypothetical protein
MTARKSTPAPLTPPGGQVRRAARVYDDLRHDPYEPKGKPSQPAYCTGCGAVFRRGRWSWTETPQGAQGVLCSACRRIRDKLPAGTVTLEGDFIGAHRDEMTHIVRNEEELEKAQYPLHRIMAVNEQAGRIVVTTTDIHLARRIGEAVHRAYQGDLSLAYGKDEYSLHAHWRR